MIRRVAVVGASGFVGSAICKEMGSRGWEVTQLRAPRLGCAEPVIASHHGDRQRAEIIEQLALGMEGKDAVVNSAGLAKPASHNFDALHRANAVLPGVVLEACRLAQVGRLLHLSSAAVQGDLCPLDESAHYRALSPYARSKMLGEKTLGAVSDRGGGVRAVVLRATSVHGPGRHTTRRLIQLARSPFSSTLAPGLYPTPQVLVENLGAAAEYLCRHEVLPPPIVLQPWEGWRTASFLQMLSNRWPRLVPAAVGQALLGMGGVVAASGARLAQRRRLEMLWRGQDQAAGWLHTVGFTPPYDREHWDRLVHDTGRERR